MMPLEQPPPRGSETVLLVSSEPGTRKLAAFMLQKQGYMVMEARDSAQAGVLYAEHYGEIDLLLMDVAMPRANGRDLAMKFCEAKPGLRLLFMSGAESPTTRGLREQGVAVLEKPFTMHGLAGKVREVLDLPQAAAMGTGD